MNIENHRPIFDIVSLIPVGRDFAISRENLVRTCLDMGIVSENNADRETRTLIMRAREYNVILNNSDGKGYYRPSPDDAQSLAAYIKQEESRGKRTFRNISLARKLYEDYSHERIQRADSR